MIKYLNNTEINSMKKNFISFINFKKFTLTQKYKDFISFNLSLEKALEIYEKEILKENYYSILIDEILIEYFYKNNVFDESLKIHIIDILKRLDKKVYIDTDSVAAVIKNFSLRLNYNARVVSIYDIMGGFIDEKDKEVFEHIIGYLEDIRNDYVEENYIYCSDMQSLEEYKETVRFEEIFGDDTCYIAIEKYSMSKKIQELLKESLLEEYCAVYFVDNYGYIELSDQFVSEKMDNRILLLILADLYLKRNMVNII